MPSVDARIVGPGRAGTALATALRDVGWTVDGPLGRRDRLRRAGAGARFCILAVPDRAVAAVARSIEPRPDVVVVHLAGALGLDVLDGHPRRASLHPLTSIPTGPLGAQRLFGATYAAAGDLAVTELSTALDGRTIAVPDAKRAAYHAAATVASNHLVALMGQVARIAAANGLPTDAYWDLVRATIDNVVELGPAAALTGPVARGDWATVARHLETLAEDERAAYRIMAESAHRLVEQAR